MTKDNETVILNDHNQIEHSENENAASFLSLINDDYNKDRTYTCIANNSVGIGTMCSIKVEGK